MVRVSLGQTGGLKAVLPEQEALRAKAGLAEGIFSGWSQWAEGESYTPLQKVSYNGSSYVCMTANTGVAPEADVSTGDGVEGTYWLLIAKRGDVGETGATGPKGETGETGPQGEQGEKGETGERGPQGEQGEAFTYADFTPEQLEGLKGPKGDKGDTGEQGEAFTYDDFTAEQLNELVVAPSWDVGEVKTLEPGEAATATLGGDRANPVLSLGIPRGANGADGYGGAVVNNKVLKLTRAGEATIIPIATTEKLGGIIVGDNLTVTESGRLSVDTADEPEADNTRPITAAAVQTSIGNIELLLGTI